MGSARSHATRAGPIAGGGWTMTVPAVFPVFPTTGALKTSGGAPSKGAPKINAVRSNRLGKTQQNQRQQSAILQGVRVPRHVIETEVFGNRTWRSVVSSDGVVCKVGTLRKRTLSPEPTPAK